MEMPEVVLAPAEDKHLDSISEVYQSSINELCSADYDADLISWWKESKSIESRRQFLKNKQMWVALYENAVLGFVISNPGEVLALFMHPAYCGKGIAFQLLKKGVELASSDDFKFIHVESTLTAKGFYQKFGFKIEGYGEYSHGESTLAIPVINMSLKTEDIFAVFSVMYRCMMGAVQSSQVTHFAALVAPQSRNIARVTISPDDHKPEKGFRPQKQPSISPLMLWLGMV